MRLCYGVAFVLMSLLACSAEGERSLQESPEPPQVTALGLPEKEAHALPDRQTKGLERAFIHQAVAHLQDDGRLLMIDHISDAIA